MKDDAFVITVHAPNRVLEVCYPARVGEANFELYQKQVRAAITALARDGGWDCIVDQTKLKALAPEFPPRIAELNAWARANGMRRTARLVSDSAIGELQTLRILREAGVTATGAVFKDRNAAWRFVTTGSSDAGQ